jgi:hypothetical protein
MHARRIDDALAPPDLTMIAISEYAIPPNKWAFLQ